MHLASVTIAGSIFFFWKRPRPCRNFVPLYRRRSRREQYCLRPAKRAHRECWERATDIYENTHAASACL